jgi:hypothetical protein
LIMTERIPDHAFGKRKGDAPEPTPPAKRSGHVALLVMGTLAVGGTAYTLMPRQSCEPATPGMAAPALPLGDTACTDRRSSGGGGGGSGGGGSSRSSDDSSGRSSSEARSGSVTRGGFGSLARAFGFGDE